MKIEEKKENINNKVSAFKIFKPYIYMAFCIVILAIAVKGLLYFSVGNNKNIQINESNSEQSIVETMIFEVCSDQTFFYDFIQDTTNDKQEYTDSLSIQENIILNYSIEY